IGRILQRSTQWTVVKLNSYRRNVAIAIASDQIARSTSTFAAKRYGPSTEYTRFGHGLRPADPTGQE
ncbi:MAG: hypothetical protein QOG30_1084, partial [Acidimicrobiaceae bacterium]